MTVYLNQVGAPGAALTAMQGKHAQRSTQQPGVARDHWGSGHRVGFFNCSSQYDVFNVLTLRRYATTRSARCEPRWWRCRVGMPSAARNSLGSLEVRETRGAGVVFPGFSYFFLSGFNTFC